MFGSDVVLLPLSTDSVAMHATWSSEMKFPFPLLVDSAQTVSIVKRVQFTPAGEWAEAVANAKPASEDLLGGLKAEPFLLAIGGIVPQKTLHDLMKVSVQMMQSQPTFKLTPEQAQKYAELSAQSLSGIRSMRMLLGVPESGTVEAFAAGPLYSASNRATNLQQAQGHLQGGSHL